MVVVEPTGVTNVNEEEAGNRGGRELELLPTDQGGELSVVNWDAKERRP